MFEGRLGSGLAMRFDIAAGGGAIGPARADSAWARGRATADSIVLEEFTATREDSVLELRGRARRSGDAWDAKLRRQINDCALFVPIVSTHSQERREGYFRLEWRLADERSRLMAEGTPFVLPVVTDGIEFTNRYAKDIVRELRQSGAALHAVMLGTFSYSDEHSIRERLFTLDDGTKATGGQRITLLAPHGLAAAMQRLARELTNQYKVVYGRPDSLYNADVVEIASARPGITMRGTPERGQTGETK